MGCLLRGGLGPCQEKRIYNLIICSSCLLKDRLCGIRFLTKDCVFQRAALYPCRNLTLFSSERLFLSTS